MNTLNNNGNFGTGIMEQDKRYESLGDFLNGREKASTVDNSLSVQETTKTTEEVKFKNAFNEYDAAIKNHNELWHNQKQTADELIEVGRSLGIDYPQLLGFNTETQLGKLDDFGHLLSPVANPSVKNRAVLKHNELIDKYTTEQVELKQSERKIKGLLDNVLSVSTTPEQMRQVFLDANMSDNRISEMVKNQKVREQVKESLREMELRRANEAEEAQRAEAVEKVRLAQIKEAEELRIKEQAAREQEQERAILQPQPVSPIGVSSELNPTEPNPIQPSNQPTSPREQVVAAPVITAPSENVAPLSAKIGESAEESTQFNADDLRLDGISVNTISEMTPPSNHKSETAHPFQAMEINEEDELNPEEILNGGGHVDLNTVHVADNSQSGGGANPFQYGFGQTKLVSIPEENASTILGQYDNTGGTKEITGDNSSFELNEVTDTRPVQPPALTMAKDGGGAAEKVMPKEVRTAQAKMLLMTPTGEEKDVSSGLGELREEKPIFSDNLADQRKEGLEKQLAEIKSRFRDEGGVQPVVLKDTFSDMFSHPKGESVARGAERPEVSTATVANMVQEKPLPQAPTKVNIPVQEIAGETPLPEAPVVTQENTTPIVTNNLETSQQPRAEVVSPASIASQPETVQPIAERKPIDVTNQPVQVPTTIQSGEKGALTPTQEGQSRLGEIIRRISSFSKEKNPTANLARNIEEAKANLSSNS